MCVPYTRISVEGLRSVTTLMQAGKLRLQVDTDIKPDTEIGKYETYHVCHFLVPFINPKSYIYAS